jgi:hypothetical protein
LHPSPEPLLSASKGPIIQKIFSLIYNFDC